MSSKRSVQDISASSSPGGGGGDASPFKRPKQHHAVELDPISACLLNLDVPLARVMLFFDIDDIPSTTQTCKCWRDALKSVEDELWLGLVRKHRPSVEQITKLLPDHVGKEEEDTTIGKDGIPPPSRSWKKQFQRHHMIKQFDHMDEKVVSPPLNSYFFEVAYEFPDKDDFPYVTRKQVSIVVEEPAFWDFGGKSISFLFKRDHLVEHLTDWNDLRQDCFRVSVRIFERSTGRQTFLFRNSPNDNDWVSKCNFLNNTNSTYSLPPLVRHAPIDEDCLNVRLMSALSAGIEGSNLLSNKLNFKVSIHFAVCFSLNDEEEGFIDEEHSELSQRQILDFLQNKLAWK